MKNKNYVLYFYCTLNKKASAGVATIYKIIDFINRSGIPSYIILQNETIGGIGYENPGSINSKYIAKLLTNEILENNIKDNKKPIFIYPDIVSNNPFKAENVCRLFLYYNGLLTGKSSLNNCKNEGHIYFSEKIKAHANVSSALYKNIICLPIADEVKLVNIKHDTHVRSKIYYYDAKFSNNLNGVIPKDIKKYEKLDRDQKNSLSQNELFKKLRSAKLVHIFEDTALIYEALLLGCSVNIHPDGAFYKNTTLVSDDVNLFGAISKREVEDIDIELSKNDIDKFKEEYKLWRKKGYTQITSFLGNLNKHEGNFNKKNISVLKKHLKKTEYYLKLSNKEIKNNSNIFTRIKFFITLIFIKSLYRIYLLIIKNRFGNLILKKPLYSIYSLLPESLKYVIISNIKKFKS